MHICQWKGCAVLIIVLVTASYAFGESDDAYRKAFIEHLEMKPASYLNLNAHGFAASEIDERIMALYHQNGFQPYWLKGGKPIQRAMVMRTVLENANIHGLDPVDYYVNEIRQVWNSREVDGQVQLDILLTLGMFRYVADQREGRLDPRNIDAQLFATAHDVSVDWLKLRRLASEAPDLRAFLDTQAPPFRQYDGLKRKLADYRKLAENGGWPTVPAGQTLKMNMDDPRIIEVRKRLVVIQEMRAQSKNSTYFDAELEDAVKRFQRRHNLKPDGVVGPKTLAAMNVTVHERIQQIIINMERYRWLKRDLMGVRGVAVNIAGFEAVALREAVVELSMPVIVGKKYHMTPVFNDMIKYVVINPYWTQPPSIARNETLPKLKKDPTYLKKHNMRLFQGWQADAPELDSTAIDWHNVSKKKMNRYRVRQDPGPNNALGVVKLVFPNAHNVYLHDTPSRGLFKQEQRAMSHGCIRMGRPAEMAAWVLGGDDNGWSLEQMNQAIASQKRQVVVLDQPIPVYILYRTAFVNPEHDEIYFYEDIYGRDRLLLNALFGAGE